MGSGFVTIGGAPDTRTGSLEVSDGTDDRFHAVSNSDRSSFPCLDCLDAERHAAADDAVRARSATEVAVAEADSVPRDENPIWWRTLTGLSFVGMLLALVALNA